jgi:diguanylate cyclase (GGDEF)-like protein/PAS domain S-box-containing protein
MQVSQQDRRYENGASRDARPFEDDGLLLHLGPFIGLTLITLAIVSFTYDGVADELVRAWVIVAAIAASVFLLPWSRFPASWQAAPILLLYVVAALVRDATGGAESVFTALFLLPVVWFALYGTLNQVLLSVAGCFIAIGLPVLLVGGPEYPTRELGRAALDSMMTGALGLTGIYLMRRIREREELSRSILNSTQEAFVSVDQKGRVVEWNSQAERDFGWPRAEVLGRSLAETIIPERDLEHYETGIQRMLDGDRRILGRRLEITAARRDGSTFPVELSFSPMTTTTGLHYNAFLRDISERRRSEEALHQANQRFRSAFDDAAIGMAMVGTDGRFLRVNRSLADLLGYSEDQLVKLRFADITHPDDLGDGLQALEELIEGLRDRYQTEKRYVHANGDVIWADLSTTIVRDGEGEPLYFLSQIQDVRERKETEAQLSHRASHDELTGLPNRGVLEDRTVLALNRQRRERKPISLLYLDLDGFKRVNDTHGHDAGDYLLVAVAKRLTALVRPTDVVSRLGGDEFAILCEGMNEQAATQLAKRIVEVVPKPIEVQGHSLTVTPSVGITLSRDPGIRPAELLSEADTAMYFAKDENRSGYAFYEEQLRGRNRGLALTPPLNG